MLLYYKISAKFGDLYGRYGICVRLLWAGVR